MISYCIIVHVLWCAALFVHLFLTYKEDKRKLMWNSSTGSLSRRSRCYFLFTRYFLASKRIQANVSWIQQSLLCRSPRPAPCSNCFQCSHNMSALWRPLFLDCGWLICERSKLEAAHFIAFIKLYNHSKHDQNVPMWDSRWDKSWLTPHLVIRLPTAEWWCGLFEKNENKIPKIIASCCCAVLNRISMAVEQDGDAEMLAVASSGFSLHYTLA